VFSALMFNLLPTFRGECYVLTVSLESGLCDVIRYQTKAGDMVLNSLLTLPHFDLFYVFLRIVFF